MAYEEMPDVEELEAQQSPRKRGLRMMRTGLILFVPGLLLFSIARSLLLSMFGTVEGDHVTARVPGIVVLVIGLPMTAGYVQLMRGFYGFVFGSRGLEHSLGWSLFRILFGVVVTVGMILVLLLTLAAAS